MSHGDNVTEPPKDWSNCDFETIRQSVQLKTLKGKFMGFNFIPEVHHTEEGVKNYLEIFFFEICKM